MRIYRSFINEPRCVHSLRALVCKSGVWLPVCESPGPCVTLLPIMSPFSLQSNLTNTAHTSLRRDVGLEMLRAIHRLYPQRKDISSLRNTHTSHWQDSYQLLFCYFPTQTPPAPRHQSTATHSTYPDEGCISPHRVLNSSGPLPVCCQSSPSAY